MEMRYVYEAKSEVVLSRGKHIARRRPTGVGHLFKMEWDKSGVFSTVDKSLCGKTMTQISQDVVMLKDLASSLPVCPECAEAWKNDPQSPWHRWVVNSTVTDQRILTEGPE